MSAITDCPDQHAEAGIAESEHRATLAERQSKTLGEALQECSADLEAKPSLQSGKIGDIDEQ
jgi:hypothetical protein